MPILIHGGRGLPPIADNLARLVDAYPEAQLIIAHAGIADLSGLAGHFAGKAGVFFDTSVWSPIDLLELLPPRAARADRLRVRLPVRHAAAVAPDLAAHGAHRRPDRAADPRACSPATRTGSPTASRRSSRRSRRAPTSSQQPMALARIHQYLSMAMPMLFARQQDTFGALGLALNATNERNGHVEELEQIRELLVAARELWRTLPEADDDADARVDRAHDVAAHPSRRHRGGDDAVPELELTVNGGEHDVDAPVGTSLAQLLRERARPHRHEDRVQRGPLRRVHGADRRRADALVHHARAHGRAARSRRSRACATIRCRRVRARRRRAVRLLHAGPGRVGRSARRREPRARPSTRSATRWRATSAAAAPIRESRRRSCIGETDPHREGGRGPLRGGLARRRGGSARRSGPPGR